jgi:hypothetical protein
MEQGTMREVSRSARGVVVFSVALMGVSVACSGKAGNDVACGPGTTLDGGVCYATTGGSSSLVDASPTPDADMEAEAGTPPFGGVTSVAPASLTALQVTWTAWGDASTPAALMKYRVYVATQTGQENFTVPQATSPPGATSMIVDALQGSTKYFVVVHAVDSAGVESSTNVEQSATTQADTHPPTFAGAASSVAGPQSSLAISWAPATDDLTPPPGITYYVYLALVSGGEDLTSPNFVSDVGATSISISALPKPGATYYAIVRARDAAGNIDSNTIEVSSASGADTVPPQFAGCTSAVTKDAADVTVGWTAATDNTTPQDQIAYDVYASTAPGGEDFTTPAATFTGATVGSVSGLLPGTTYFFVCRARDVSGNEDANTSERIAATRADNVPPVFGGVTSVANIGASTVDLVWSAPATDDQTPQNKIVYLAYQSLTPGGEAFTSPAAATSQPGATTLTVSGLAPETTYYWVVRARDLAGNLESNAHEASATTTVSFSQNVVTILGQHCAVQGCHIPPAQSAPEGLMMTPPLAYANLVNVPVNEYQPADGGVAYRVLPGDPADSYIYLKITGTAPAGTQMPPPTQNDPLDPNGPIKIIHDWIQQGALDN